MPTEYGQAQTEGKMCLPRHAEACTDARGPIFKCLANDSVMTSDIVARDISIDQPSSHF